jgi:hypothetical protein
MPAPGKRIKFVGDRAVQAYEYATSPRHLPAPPFPLHHVITRSNPRAPTTKQAREIT